MWEIWCKVSALRSFDTKFCNIWVTFWQMENISSLGAPVPGVDNISDHSETKIIHLFGSEPIIQYQPTKKQDNQLLGNPIINNWSNVCH